MSAADRGADERSDIRDSLCICYNTRISLRSRGPPSLKADIAG
jgi:hypothetical protein